ncbi:MAG: isocitrate lyase/phosphoenolpyruvate mutase family protein [Kangiellaceae bacterium]|nr:isocitrate lyase/phosphoenolpyruvate mutase family protein [Kangiellaceae bacterium]
MPASQDKTSRFQSLHTRKGSFIMPNAWDPGSAIVLANTGFEAIATTSAGIAFAAGLSDHQRMSKDVMLEKIKEIVDVAGVPVNADLEAGYSDNPEGVADIIGQAIDLGIAGANIEDFTGDSENPLFELEEATDRIIAAVSFSGNSEFVLTARCDAYLTGHPKAFEESVKRCNRYLEAGADCIFVPGISDKETISKLIREVQGPFNVVMGLSGNLLTKDDLSNCGVKRISVGGSIARATFDFIRKAGEEMMNSGTFTFANEQFAHGDLCDLFERWEHR